MAIGGGRTHVLSIAWKANPFWGSPRIVGELKKLGIEVAKSTVERYRPRHRKPPSQTWRTFLQNHAKDIVAADFFFVPTVKFRVLFGFVVLAHLRRKLVHFNVTEHMDKESLCHERKAPQEAGRSTWHPTSVWAAQQIVDSFPWGDVPRFLLRDRDGVYGGTFNLRVHNMGIEEVLTAPRRAPPEDIADAP